MSEEEMKLESQIAGAQKKYHEERDVTLRDRMAMSLIGSVMSRWPYDSQLHNADEWVESCWTHAYHEADIGLRAREAK